MKKLRISFVAGDSARDKALAERISLTLRAATSGRTAAVLPVKPTEEAEAQFVLTGESTGTALTTFDFTGKNVENGLIRQPALLDLAIAGLAPPEGAGKKVTELDSDRFTWCIVSPDSLAQEYQEKFPGRVLSESELFEQPDRVNRSVSHVFLVSEHGGPIVAERLAAYQVAMPFYVGAAPGFIDLASTVPCSNIEEAFVKAEALASASGGTVQAFKTQVLTKTFSRENVTARSARAVIGSLLRMKTGDDFGLLELHIADKRLLELATGPKAQ